MSTWFNYEASLKILFFGLLLGSGLPALFALACGRGPRAPVSRAPMALPWGTRIRR